MDESARDRRCSFCRRVGSPMSPYVVTTKRSAVTVSDEQCMRVVSRRAVATLDEAGEKFHEHLYSLGIEPQGTLGKEWQWWADAWRERTSESGGTVGPLPDGTVIDVEPMTWEWLADRSDLTESERSNLAYEPERNVIACAAFNAQEATR